jgi:hypothetical protein
LGESLLIEIFAHPTKTRRRVVNKLPRVLRTTLVTDDTSLRNLGHKSDRTIRDAHAPRSLRFISFAAVVLVPPATVEVTTRFGDAAAIRAKLSLLVIVPPNVRTFTKLTSKDRVGAMGWDV